MNNKNIIENLENLINLEELLQIEKQNYEELKEKNDKINMAKMLIEKAYEKMKNSVTPKFTSNLSENIFDSSVIADWLTIVNIYLKFSADVISAFSGILQLCVIFIPGLLISIDISEIFSFSTSAALTFPLTVISFLYFSPSKFFIKNFNLK